MRTYCIALAAIALAGSIVIAADEPKPSVDASAAFTRLKGLAGQWEGTEAKMGKSRLTYEVVSGGSALIERFTSDQLPAGSDMITMYHLDGDRLLLTHYCMARNQPRMAAVRFDASTGELDFDFVDATSLKPGAGHMHSARFRFVDDEHFTATWDFVEGGKIKETEKVAYKRIR